MKYDPEYTRNHYNSLAHGEAERWQVSKFMKMRHRVFQWHLRQRVRLSTYWRGRPANGNELRIGSRSSISEETWTCSRWDSV